MSEQVWTLKLINLNLQKGVFVLAQHPELLKLWWETSWLSVKPLTTQPTMEDFSNLWADQYKPLNTSTYNAEANVNSNYLNVPQETTMFDLHCN